MTTKQQSSYYQLVVPIPAPKSKFFLEGRVECLHFKQQLEYIPT